ncbi:MAG: DUF2905 domain-containing protein [Hyphomicrobiaceae bacterium]
MAQFVIFVIGILAALVVIGLFADKRAAKGNAHVTPGLKLLPGDIKYESPNGNVRIYFPIMTSIVASIVLSLVLWLFR